jgi:hypothetical protein
VVSQPGGSVWQVPKPAMDTILSWFHHHWTFVTKVHSHFLLGLIGQSRPFAFSMSSVILSSLGKVLFSLRCTVICIKGKDIPVTDRGGPWGCETSRLPHFLDNRLTEGGEVSLTRWSPRKILGSHFYQRLIGPRGYSTTGRVRSIEKSSDLIGNWIRGLPFVA